MTDKELAEIRASVERYHDLPWGKGMAERLLAYIDFLHKLLSDMERDGGIEAGRRAERARVLGLIDGLAGNVPGWAKVRYRNVAELLDAVKDAGPAEALPGDEARARVAELEGALREMLGLYRACPIVIDGMEKVAREALGEG